MTFFSCIEENFNHVIQTCREKGRGYRLKLGNLSNYRILDGDSFSQREKSCDCIILVIDDNQLIVIISELKSTVKSVDDIVKKMQNSARLVKSMIQWCNTDRLSVSFHPILVRKKGIRRSPLIELKKGSSRKCVSGNSNNRNAIDSRYLNGRRVPSRRNAEGVVSLMGGGHDHNAEGGLEEKVTI